MVKLIIFDLQGTLIENGVFPSPVKQVKFILNIRQDFQDYVPVFEEVFMTKRFEGLSQAFKAVAEQFNVEVKDFSIEKLIGIWNKNKLLSKPFPETLSVLEELSKEYILVLAANIDCFSKDIVEKYKLEEFFDKIFLSCDTGMLKGEKLFKEIMKSMEVEPDDVLVVGDSMESDIKSAVAAGVDAVLVDRNNRMLFPKKIPNLHELKKFL